MARKGVLPIFCRLVISLKVFLESIGASITGGSVLSD